MVEDGAHGSSLSSGVEYRSIIGGEEKDGSVLDYSSHCPSNRGPKRSRQTLA